jgi:hypothetical protein
MLRMLRFLGHRSVHAAVPTDDHFGRSKRKAEKGGSVKKIACSRLKAAVPRPVFRHRHDSRLRTAVPPCRSFQAPFSFTNEDEKLFRHHRCVGSPVHECALYSLQYCCTRRPERQRDAPWKAIENDEGRGSNKQPSKSNPTKQTHKKRQRRFNVSLWKAAFFSTDHFRFCPLYQT